MSAKDNLFLTTQLRAVDVNYRCLNYNNIGREPWSSGYGSRLTIKRSRVRILHGKHGILDGSRLFVVKKVLFGDEQNKWTRGRWWVNKKITRNIHSNLLALLNSQLILSKAAFMPVYKSNLLKNMLQMTRNCADLQHLKMETADFVPKIKISWLGKKCCSVSLIRSA